MLATGEPDSRRTSGPITRVISWRYARFLQSGFCMLWVLACARMTVLHLAVIVRVVVKANLSQFDSLITRPLLPCTGRAFNGYNRENSAICAGDACIVCFMTIYSTPSVHGGSLSDPMNV